MARYCLNFTDDEFFNCTPRKLNAILKLQNEKNEHKEPIKKGNAIDLL